MTPEQFSKAGFAAVLLPLLLGSATAATPCSRAITGVVPAASAVVIQSACGSTLIEPWGADIVRIRHLPAGAAEPNPSLVVNGKRPPARFAVTQSDTEVVAATPDLRIIANKKDGQIALAKIGATAPFLSESHGAITPTSSGLYKIIQSFAAPQGLHYYGLGQHPAGGLDLRKESVHLQQANGSTGLPVLLTSAGWGLLWDNASVTDVSLGRPSDGPDLVFSSEAAQAVDYYVITGANADAVVAGYRRLTGAAPMLPRWAWGFWQSYEHYATADEIVGVARRYREMHIPIDGIIQDWQYWVPGQWGAHKFDPARYPDPTKMVSDLHALNLHTIVSVWPRFDAGTANRAELDAAGALFPKTYPNVYPPGFGRWYDPFGHGRDLYWKQISETLGRNGFDGWWLDASEAELGGDWGEMRDVQTAAGPGSLVYNAYPLMHTTGVFDGHRRDFPNRRPVILTRSAWAGQQRNNAISWSGDIHGDWETFRRQIPAGLNFVSAGIPYWNTDIGGFFAGDPADPAYSELFVRWFEYGAFTPMFRVHGTGKSKEMWRFPEDTQRILLRYDRLRYRLLPYIYSLAWSVTSDGGTMMRPLVFDFGDDPDALDIPDQFMFGPGIMVAPVTRRGATVRTAYLPGNADWYDFWTGKRLSPRQTIATGAPLDTEPLFVRAGTILPMGPVVEYAAAQANAPLELRIYRGANGRFTLYDDSGDGWGYERGKRATIGIDWNDTARTLTFSARNGSFPGLKTERTFRVVWAGENAGTGDAPATTATVVAYKGKRLQIAGPPG
jgi:alpha-D-xyloside xylohydrolase